MGIQCLCGQDFTRGGAVALTCLLGLDLESVRSSASVGAGMPGASTGGAGDCSLEAALTGFTAMLFTIVTHTCTGISADIQISGAEIEACAVMAVLAREDVQLLPRDAPVPSVA